MQRADLAVEGGRVRPKAYSATTSRPEARNGQTGFLLACDHTSRGEYRRGADILIGWSARHRRSSATGSSRAAATRCWARSKRPSPATASASPCGPISPAPTWRGRRSATTTAGNLHQALADLDQALRLDPAQYRARMDRSLVLGVLGRDREAWRNSTRCWRIRPPRPACTSCERPCVNAWGTRGGPRKDRASGMKTTPGDADSWIARGVERVAADPAGARWPTSSRGKSATPARSTP